MNLIGRKKNASQKVTSSVEAVEKRTRSSADKGIIALKRKALLKWFLVGARNLLKRVIPLNKRGQNFVSKHREDFNIISNAQVSDEERKLSSNEEGRGFWGEPSFVICLSGKILRGKKARTRGPKNLPLGGFVRRGKRRKIPPIMDEEGSLAQSPLAQSPLA